MTTVYAVGFTSGYFVASAVLSFPLYLVGLDDDFERSQLPGAWWLGYVILSSLLCLSAVPLFWFPASLPPREDETEGQTLLNEEDNREIAAAVDKHSVFETESQPEKQGFLESLPSNVLLLFPSVYSACLSPNFTKRVRLCSIDI